MRFFREVEFIIFRRKFSGSFLHWLSCGAIVAYILVNQYIYAVSDKTFLPDHDSGICREILRAYNYGPLEYMAALARQLIIHAPDTSVFTNFVLAVSFYAFGRTLFVFKMCMAYALIIICLGVYFIVFRLTRKAYYGVIAAATVFNLPVVVEISRKQFSYLPLAAVCVMAILIVVRDMRLNSRHNCVFLAACLWIGASIHNSVFIYFLFICVYLIFVKKNPRHYSLILALYLALFAARLPFLSSWLQGKINYGVSNGGSFSGAYFISELKRIYACGYESGTYFIVYSIILNSFILLGLRFFAPKSGSCGVAEACSGIKFILLFFVYAFFMYVGSFVVMGHVPSYTHTTLFVLEVIACFVLFYLVSRGPAFLKIYAAACILLLAYQLIYKADYFQLKDYKELPILLNDQENERGMLKFNADMEDVTPLLSALEQESRRYGSGDELPILQCGLTVCRDKEDFRVNRLYPLVNYWDESTGFEGIYSAQAFYRGIKLVPKNVIMLFDSGESGGRYFKGAPGPANPEWEKEIKERYEAQFNRDISGFRYLFLTVLTQCEDKNELWNIPQEKIIIDRIRENDGRVYRKFFRDAGLIMKRRMHKNLFLYVFRTHADRQGK